MKIKKCQKIICLGLALISIMVLPCYANQIQVGNDYILEGVNNTTLDKININEYGNFENVINNEVEKYKIKVGQGFNIVPREGIVNVYAINNNINYFYFMAIFTNVTGDFGLQTAVGGVVLNPIETKIIESPLGLASANLYKINFTHFTDGYKSTQIKYMNTEGELFPTSIMMLLFNNVENAVLNITTYTNLLIQNFSKAFTFMTGPALPWVLLGISVSLISFGVYSAKRFL